MKLAIGINIFESYERQNRAIQVLKTIKEKHSNLIDLYNITFSDEKNLESNFIHLPLLNKKVKQVLIESKSKKPFVKQFFDILSIQDCDYFLFLNSDILISNKLIKFIQAQEYETYCFSRYDVYPLQKYNDPIIPFRIEIAGFDAWCVKKEWWSKNNHLFQDYIYAEHLWDVDYTLTMFNNSKCYLGNKEFFIAHEKHDLKWNEDSIEAKYNSSLWQKTPYHQKWHEFIFSNLIKRNPYGQFFNPLYNESELEQKYLKLNETHN